LPRFYEPDLGADPNSPFARDAANKLVRRSYWLDMAGSTLVLVMTKGIGAHLTNDEKRTHLTDLKREHLIDQVCVRRFYRLRKGKDRGLSSRPSCWDAPRSPPKRRFLFLASPISKCSLLNVTQQDVIDRRCEIGIGGRAGRTEDPMLYMGFMATGILLLFVTSATAQFPPPSIPPMVPHPNPSSSLVLPQAPPIPVSPAPNFYPGSNLAGTNQVVNPSLGVFHAHHKRRHHSVR
jgi:hypothetical protein